MTSRPSVRHAHLTPGRIAPRQARSIVRALLLDTDPSVVERAMLLTSEIVTNAVIHAATRVELHARVEDGVLRVAVEDGDDRVPTALEEAGPEGGFGLHIVEELAEAWGVTRLAHGKAVWFEVKLAPGSARADADLQRAFG